MGLDNYPSPLPCELLEKPGKLKIARDAEGHSICKETPCPFHKVDVLHGRLGKDCWIRGGVYDYLVRILTDYSLYEIHNAAELRDILMQLKEAKLRDKTLSEFINLFPEEVLYGPVSLPKEKIEEIKRRTKETGQNPLWLEIQEWKKYNASLRDDERIILKCEEIKEDYNALISYLETLLNIEEWVNHPNAELRAWW